MDIFVLSLEEALMHEPPRTTYATRLRSSNISPSDTRFWGRLRNSKRYAHVHEYEFDDLYPDFNQGGKLINPDIAGQIVSDFNNGRRECEDLLVHCFAGKGRSPAVAIALNEIFNLGQSTKRMKQIFPAYNDFVYQSLIKAAKSMPDLS